MRPSHRNKKPFTDDDVEPRWRYANHARKARYCDECGKRMRKDEVVLCTSCFTELLNTTLYDDEIEQSGEGEEVDEDVEGDDE